MENAPSPECLLPPRWHVWLGGRPARAGCLGALPGLVPNAGPARLHLHVAGTRRRMLLALSRAVSAWPYPDPVPPPPAWQVTKSVIEGQRLPFPPPEQLPGGTFEGLEGYCALIERCWAQDPAQRPTFAAIVNDLRCVRSGGCMGALPQPTPQAFG